MEEHQAITKLKRGDIVGLEFLVKKYYLPAVRAAFLIIQEKSLAEDVVQTSFINLVNKIDQFDETKAFRPWFLRSVVNRAISVTRKRSRDILVDESEFFEEIASTLEPASSNGHNPEESIISEELSLTIQLALEKLSPQQRAAIVMRYYLDFSENEISQEMERPKSTVKWTLYSAREKPRQILLPADIKTDDLEED